MKTLLRLMVFSPPLLLGSGIPQVHLFIGLLVCLVIISVIHLFSLVSAPTICLESKSCISY